MAAKQGLTAHISQASEDARRAVLSRAPNAIKSHTWLSNLNTTCTIKSAPPRTPEVMTLLSNKSGWLVKRNEQQVWQRRWCCVVPHTFLYYFEAEPAREDDDDDVQTREGYSGGGIYRSDVVVVENQDMLNEAVRDGCKGRSKSTSRDGTPLKGRDANAMYHTLTPSGEKVTQMAPAPVRGPTNNGGILSPAGIIDLECYTCIDRSTMNDCVFELTGDQITNPDLRSFYFQAGSVEDCELWTNALISDRHSALRDEREAYRQVCDSFQLQLQNLSDMIDEAESKTAQTENKLYNVRSATEKFRTEIVKIVREALEQKCWSSGNIDGKSASDVEKLDHSLEKSRIFFLDSIDEVISSENIGTTKNTGAIIAQILADYLATVVGSYTELGVIIKSMDFKLSRSAGVDKAEVSDLKHKLEQLEAERDHERSQYQAKITSMADQINEVERVKEELENQMQTQRVEFSMFQNQAKSKLQELSQHKKILKKEVIDLRKKLDHVGSERDAALHITDSHKLHAETEKQKNVVLEKYIEKIENQVNIQQNMMEMISLSGMSQAGDGENSTGFRSRSGSVVGRIIGAPDDSSFSNFGQQFRTRDGNSVRDASPFRLPPRSDNQPHPPLSPTKRLRQEENPSHLTPPKPKQKNVKKKQSSRSSQQPYDENNEDEPPMPLSNAPHRGTLDHEFLGNENGASQTNVRYQKSREKKINGNYVKENRLSNGIDDDDDTKSHFSDLTEDRTQRALGFEDKRQGLQFTMSDMTGEDVIDGLPKKDLRSNPEELDSSNYPPRYIMGTPDNKNESSDDHHHRDDTYSVKSTSDSTSHHTKLSVAQRARLAAEQPKTVNVAANTQTLRLSETRQSAPAPSSVQSRPKVRSQSPGVFSNLASMISKKTDGVKSQSNETNNNKAKKQNNEVTLSLAERQQIQRERQMRVLREQGLLKD